MSFAHSPRFLIFLTVDRAIFSSEISLLPSLARLLAFPSQQSFLDPSIYSSRSCGPLNNRNSRLHRSKCCQPNFVLLENFMKALSPKLITGAHLVNLTRRVLLCPLLSKSTQWPRMTYINASFNCPLHHTQNIYYFRIFKQPSVRSKVVFIIILSQSLQPPNTKMKFVWILSHCRCIPGHDVVDAAAKTQPNTSLPLPNPPHNKNHLRCLL